MPSASTFITSAWILLISLQAHSQPADEYQKIRTELVRQFQNKPAGKFGSFVKGVKTHIVTDRKIIALTFDACGGPRGGGYDEELIRYLRREKIPATLFLTGMWIDEHPDLVKDLVRDSLFEIENHGLRHRPCSSSGQSRYGIRGTANAGEAADEIELNALKIQQFTNRKPRFFRPATATCDEACGEIATQLNESIVHFDILSGDAVAGTATKTLEDNIIKKVHPGAIVIMHMNHPEWNGFEALQAAIPQLRKRGYSFVKLAGQILAENP